MTTTRVMTKAVEVEREVAEGPPTIAVRQALRLITTDRCQMDRTCLRGDSTKRVASSGLFKVAI